MIELNLEIDGENKVYNLPTSWDEVTVGQYEKISQIDKTLLENEYISLVIHYLGGVDISDVNLIYVEDFIEIKKALNFLSNEIDSNVVDSVLIDGEEYFVKKDFDKLSMGELISIETLIEQNDGNLDMIISKALCIFLRKKLDNGKLESFRNEFMDREELFKSIKIIDVHNLFAFFLTGENT